jgi:L-histidine N-alpha-methyltransferase
MTEQAASPASASHHDYRVRPVEPTRAVNSLADDVIEGFARVPRNLPPKYFYDAEGSALFDRICELSEYYPTRSEQGLLEAHADALVHATRPDHIIELGAGTARKTTALLDACQRAGLAPVYWPFDVCPSVVESTCARVSQRYPRCGVEGLVGDYTAGLGHLPRPPGRCLYLFLGGTLGNFTAAEGRALLGELAGHMGAGDHLLLGVDRVKDRAVIEAAYNDAAGVTAAFNRNVLAVINRELGGDFDPNAFRHRACFNAADSRIEMYLEAEYAQTVSLRVLEREYTFTADEPIRTEISRKFTRSMLAQELAAAGLRAQSEFVASGDYFSLTLAQRGDA